MADQSYELFVVVSSLGSFFSLAEKGGVVMECCATQLTDKKTKEKSVKSESL
jgi:hypothetical protein